MWFLAYKCSQWLVGLFSVILGKMEGTDEAL